MERTDRRATDVVRRLKYDGDLRARFRADPRPALREEGLTEAQVEAAISGDGLALASAGIDVARLDRMPLRVRLRSRAAVLLGAALGMVGGLGVTPAFAARRLEARRLVRYARVSVRALREGRYSVRDFSGVIARRADLLLVPDPHCEFKCVSLEVNP